MALTNAQRRAMFAKNKSVGEMMNENDRIRKGHELILETTYGRALRRRVRQIPRRGLP